MDKERDKYLFIYSFKFEKYAMNCLIVLSDLTHWHLGDVSVILKL